METTDLTNNDFEYILGDTLADRELLTESDVTAIWDSKDPLPNGGSWANVPCINADLWKIEAATRWRNWIPEVLVHPLVKNNRLSEHWDLAMEIAAHHSKIGYGGSCFKFN